MDESPSQRNGVQELNERNSESVAHKTGDYIGLVKLAQNPNTHFGCGSNFVREQGESKLDILRSRD